MTPLKKQIYDLLFKHRDFIKNGLSPFNISEINDSLVIISSIRKRLLLPSSDEIYAGRVIMLIDFCISKEATWYQSFGGIRTVERYMNVDQIKDFEKIRLLQALEKNGQK